MSKPIPFSEPPYLLGLPSPYYTPLHRKWQRACRAFVGQFLLPKALEWETAEEVPGHVFQDFANHNMLLPNIGAPMPKEILREIGINGIGPKPGQVGGEEAGPDGVVNLDDWDYICVGIYIAELARTGLAGPSASVTTGMAFGVPPLINFASKDLQQRFLPQLLKGEKRTCIAITEPGAGSDVANISTTATKTPDGRHYIINGMKKWITNGIWSDYSAMAVRTGGSGPSGLSMVVCPLKGYPGVSMRRLKVAGQVSGGTTLIELDEVKIPVENLIGVEGMGMKYVMTNFNHERLTIAVGVAMSCRIAVSAAFEYVMKREAFGKPLIDQPVVRHRLAKAGAEVESLWAWVEQFLYQMCHMSKADGDRELGGLTALVKAKAGMVLDECARTAVLLFGGNGYTRTGMGELVEKIYREVPGARIPGGSEDVMLDLAIRQLVKNYRNASAGLERPKGSSKL